MSIEIKATEARVAGLPRRGQITTEAMQVEYEKALAAGRRWSSCPPIEEPRYGTARDGGRYTRLRIETEPTVGAARLGSGSRPADLWIEERMIGRGAFERVIRMRPGDVVRFSGVLVHDGYSWRPRVGRITTVRTATSVEADPFVSEDEARRVLDEQAERDEFRAAHRSDEL